mmetsp:Transcript_12776/g.19365  ORF Transcript_12776/g.19365 Transcript_12776/m.19365 type:complete len:107 (-) Transcript_12776:105-425(-)
MKCVKALFSLVLLSLLASSFSLSSSSSSVASRAFEACKTQSSFDLRMCKSYMCTECTLSWCMETCQALQEAHPKCRCESWPESRLSYSGEGMKGAGKYGDVGDYSK